MGKYLAWLMVISLLYIIVIRLNEIVELLEKVIK